MPPQSVLVVGSSGNIGVSVITAALRSGYNALALIRDMSAKEKVLSHVDSQVSEACERITFVEADVTSEDGVSKVVQNGQSGIAARLSTCLLCRYALSSPCLTIFKVFEAQANIETVVGTWLPKTPIYTVDTPSMRKVMNVAFESAFCNKQYPTLETSR
jgi:NAD(P)-dependent dehydrogenase (short-subunit alcohol dehydrogenase family)